MANVSGDSLDVVADQLTSIWNNFDDGTQSLEHYGDVMVRLGADTASSSDEIATGIQKFAAVADTVGLSYDNAAAALATVTAQTRESADTVGDAFKTIFARIEGLKLGETLDDGTNLNKYSKALSSVGINIKDETGNLKEMDNIVAEIGNKWETLNKDQQVALAQTVAGTMQYNRFIALFDNFDIYEENLERAKNAEGSLKEQADIYAESWEAAQERVKAAAEGVYKSLINDDFFISMNDSLADALNGVQKLIESLGGVKGVLAVISTLISSIFKDQMSKSFANLSQSLFTVTPGGKAVAEDLRNQAYQQTMIMLNNETAGYTEDPINQAQNNALKTKLELQKQFIEDSKNLTEEQIQQRQIMLDINEMYQQRVVNSAKELNQAKETASALFVDMERQLKSTWTNDDDYKYATELMSQAKKEFEKAARAKSSSGIATDDILKNFGSVNEQNIDDIEKEMKKLKATTNDETKALDEMNNALLEAKNSGSEDAYNKLNNALKNNSKKVEDARDGFIALGKDIGVSEETSLLLTKALELIIEKENKVSKASDEAAYHTKLLQEANVAVKDSFSQIGSGMTGLVSGFSQGVMAVSSFSGILQTLEDDSMTVGDKVVSIMTSLSFAIPSAITAVQSLKGAFSSLSAGLSTLIPQMATAIALQNTTDMSAFAKAIRQVVEAVGAENGAYALNTLLTKANADMASLSAKEKIALDALVKAHIVTIDAENGKVKLNTGITLANIIMQQLNKKALEGSTIATWALKIATDALNGSLAPLLIIILAVAAAIAAIVGTIYLVVKGFTTWSEAAKSTAEKQSELNDKMEEASDSAKTLKNDINELIKTYNEQKNAGEDVNDTLTDLNDKIKEIQDNYKTLGVDDVTLAMLEQAAAVGEATGNWDQYNNAVAEAEAQAEENLKQQNYATTVANTEGAKAAMAKGWGRRTGSSVERHVGNVGVTSSEMNKILTEYNSIFSNVSGDDAIMSIDFGSPEKFLKDYEQLEKAIREMQTAGLSTHDTYKEISKEFEAMSEYAAEVKENINSTKETQIENVLKKYDINASTISSYKDYQKALSYIIEELKEVYGSTEEAKQAGQDFLSTFSNNTDFTALEGVVDNFSNKLKTATKYIFHDSWSIDEEKGSLSIGLEPKYNEEQISEELKNMREYLNSLPEAEHTLALSLDLDGIDSVESFQTILEKTKDFEAKVKISADPESVLTTATTIRDNLQNYMESFKEQGYLTVTQATEIVQELPEYAQYLTKTAEGYAFTTEAINRYNGALEEQEEALEQITNPTQIGTEALYNLGETLIKLEVQAQSDTLKTFITDFEDLNIQFLQGKINSETFFNTLQDKINNIDISKLGFEDLSSMINSVIPETITSLDDYFGSVDEAFENGQIGATEYRAALRKCAKTMLDLEQATEDAVAAQAGIIDEVANDADNLTSSVSKTSSAASDLQESLDDMNDFEGIMQAATDNYDLLTEIFNNDYSVKIDSSELNNLSGEINSFVSDVSTQFSALSTSAQANVLDLIHTAAQNINYVGDSAYTLSQATVDAMTTAGLAIANESNAVELAATDMLYGNYNASVESTELTTAAMSTILQSGELTTQLVSQNINKVITGLSNMIKNFNASITFTPKALEGETKFPISASAFGLPSIEVLEVGVPSFGIDVKGGVTGETALAFDSVTSGLSTLGGFAAVRMGQSTGVSSYKPKSSAGSASSVNTDPKPSSSGNGGNSGSGSGGTGNKDKDKTDTYKSPQKTEKIEADIEPAEEAITRWANLDNRFSGIEKKLDRIDNLKEKAFGKDYAKAIKEENEALAEQIGLYDWQIADAEKYMQWDSEAIIKAGFQLEFDDTKAIINEEQFQKWLQEQKNRINQAYADTVNAAAAEYDASTNALGDDSDAEKDAIKETYEARKKAAEQQKEDDLDYYEGIEESLSNYKEAWEKFYDASEERESILYQIHQNDLEVITKELELHSDLIDSEKEIIDLRKKVIGEGWEHSNELFGLNIDNWLLDQSKLTEDIKAFRELQSKIDSGNYTQADEEAFADLQNTINEDISQGLEDIDTLKEAFGDMIEDWKSDIDELMDEFDSLSERVTSISNLWEMAGENYDSEKLQKYADLQAKIAENTYESSWEAYEGAKETYENKQRLEQELATKVAAGLESQETLDIFKEATKEAKTTMDELHQTALDNAEEYGEKLQEILETNITIANRKMEETIYSNKGTGSQIDQADFNNYTDYLQERQEDYLTPVNQEYETQKLINQALEEIDKTDNQAAKNKLNLFIKQTEQLQKQEKLSQAKLEIQQAEYELLLAQIALEEAQSNKSTVRLQQDSEGNFNYVYTADEDQVNDAYQNVLDKENELYNTKLDAANETAEKYIQQVADFQSKLAEIWDNEYYTQEQKYELSQELIEQYQEILADSWTEWGELLEMLGEDQSDSWSYYARSEIADSDEVVDAVSENTEQMNELNTEYQDKMEEVADRCSESYQEISNAAEDTENKISKMVSSGVNNMNTMAEKTASWSHNMEEYLTSVKDYYLEIVQAIQDAREAAANFDTNNDYMAEYQASTTIAGASAALEAREAKIKNTPEYATLYGDNPTALMEEVNDQAAQMWESSTIAGILAAAARRQAKVQEMEEHGFGSVVSGLPDTREILWDIAQSNETLAAALEAVGLPTTEKYDGYFNITDNILNAIRAACGLAAAYDTGGYTGEFGSEGKLAILHEKELVLNQEDTKNLLDSVKLVDNVLSNMSWANISSAFATLNGGAGNVATSTQALEQSVHIEASFPNVTNHNEVELALSNLINSASQYANRKSV